MIRVPTGARRASEEAARPDRSRPRLIRGRFSQHPQREFGDRFGQKRRAFASGAPERAHDRHVIFCGEDRRARRKREGRQSIGKARRQLEERRGFQPADSKTHDTVGARDRVAGRPSRDFLRGQMNFRLKEALRDRREIKESADRKHRADGRARKLRLVRRAAHEIADEMTARRMTACADRLGIAAELPRLPPEPARGAPHLIDERVHPRARHQRIVEDRRDRALGDDAVRQEAEIVLRIGPPIAPVDEQMNGGLPVRDGRLGEEQIELVVWAVAIGDIEPRREPCSRRRAGGVVVCDVVREARDMRANHERIDRLGQKSGPRKSGFQHCSAVWPPCQSRSPARSGERRSLIFPTVRPYL